MMHIAGGIVLAVFALGLLGILAENECFKSFFAVLAGLILLALL